MRSAQAMSLRAATVQLSRAHRGDVRHVGVEPAEDREFLQQGRTGTRRSVRGSAALRPAVRPRRWGRRALLRHASIVRFVQGVLAPFNATIQDPRESLGRKHETRG